MGGVVGNRAVLVFAGITVKECVDVLFIAMLESFVLSWHGVVSVLLGPRAVWLDYGISSDRNKDTQSFFRIDRLDSSVMVVLVDFLIDGGCYIFMLVRANMFIGNSLPNVLIDSGRVFPITGNKI